MSARILVVDDATTVRLYHRKILGDAGWSVSEASNGVEALEALSRQAPAEPFDLFVVDVNMPRMDGYAFVRELRRQNVHPQVPVLMVSTEGQMQDAERAQDAGANHYIIKPAKPADLTLSAALLLGDGAVARRSAATVAAAGDRA